MPSAWKKARAGQIFYVVHTYYAHIWFGGKWNTRMNVEDIYDMIVRMTEYSLMWDYYVVRYCMIIMYNNIVRKYVDLGSLPFFPF